MDARRLRSRMYNVSTTDRKAHRFLLKYLQLNESSETMSYNYLSIQERELILIYLLQV